MKNILITGGNGFIGKSLSLSLKTIKDVNVKYIPRNIKQHDFDTLTNNLDYVFHLAGANRESDDKKFYEDNSNFTNKLCTSLKKSFKKPTIVFCSSTMVKDNSIYSQTKLEAEGILKDFSKQNGNHVIILRLPNVFGKWARPNYNSVVATFCYLTARNEKITINDPDIKLNLLYIDDLVQEFINIIDNQKNYELYKITFQDSFKTHSINVGELANIVKDFPAKRANLSVENLSSHIEKILYSTYLTYLPHENFYYPIKGHYDERGTFAELFKAKTFGQISVLTVKPKMIRGGHFHHTKVEKFFVAQGHAKFTFERCYDKFIWTKSINDSENIIIESIPGWLHKIENAGHKDLIIIIWANEVFNCNIPDTFK